MIDILECGKVSACKKSNFSVKHAYVFFFLVHRDNNTILKLDNGKDLTIETFETHGFNRPMLVINKEGLGMIIPDKKFTVMDVERHVGMLNVLIFK